MAFITVQCHTTKLNLIYAQMHSYTDTYIHIYIQAGRQAGRQADRQTDIHALHSITYFTQHYIAVHCTTEFAFTHNSHT